MSEQLRRITRYWMSVAMAHAEANVETLRSLQAAHEQVLRDDETHETLNNPYVHILHSTKSTEARAEAAATQELEDMYGMIDTNLPDREESTRDFGLPANNLPDEEGPDSILGRPGWTPGFDVMIDLEPEIINTRTTASTVPWPGKPAAEYVEAPEGTPITFEPLSDDQVVEFKWPETSFAPTLDVDNTPEMVVADFAPLPEVREPDSSLDGPTIVESGQGESKKKQGHWGKNGFRLYCAKGDHHYQGTGPRSSCKGCPTDAADSDDSPF